MAVVTCNRALLNDNLINQGRIIGLNGEPSYYAAGIKYQGDRFLISVIGVIEKNGDLAQGSYYKINNDLVSPTVVFDSKGFEFYVNYKLNKFSIQAGYNLYTPKTNSIPIENNQYPLSKKFKTNDVIAGFTYQPIKDIQIYPEQYLSYGRSADYVNKFDVFALGMTLDISKTFNTKIFAK